MNQPDHTLYLISPSNIPINVRSSNMMRENMLIGEVIGRLGYSNPDFEFYSATSFDVSLHVTALIYADPNVAFGLRMGFDGSVLPWKPYLITHSAYREKMRIREAEESALAQRRAEEERFRAKREAMRRADRSSGHRRPFRDKNGFWNYEDDVNMWLCPQTGERMTDAERIRRLRAHASKLGIKSQL